MGHNSYQMDLSNGIFSWWFFIHFYHRESIDDHHDPELGSNICRLSVYPLTNPDIIQIQWIPN